MEVTRQGDVGVLLSFKTGVVVINPSKKVAKATALLSTYPVSVKGWEIQTDLGEGQKRFTGPGEYEKEGIVMRGIGSQTERQKSTLQTTSWLLCAEDIPLLIFGDVATSSALKHITSEVGGAEVVVLFLPDDGEKRPSATEYASAVANLQAKRLILIGDNKKTLTALAKEVGNSESLEGKYTIKKKDLDGATGIATILL